ncbi:hypothetical protein BXZ70DRAFT_955383 [Cristinia sonorae]|uniref:Uncharacterized protein n=1 Tax=Cristinia sonorae TaxID=1940300 RepID=A0A8K0UG43_9AGAR|nr:hypothetical protein BXZ70DRAFT_955383 [Cristinia sonorae]
MATPYSTPGHPKAPKPTPSTVTLSNRAAIRAPIHNPFDKFTQPEFDAWIGDITGALKRALGREEPPPLSARRAQQLEDVSAGDISAYGEPDDSFAEIKARRAAKGKERAREEDFSDYEEDRGTPDVVVISSDEDEDEEEDEDASDESAVDEDELEADVRDTGGDWDQEEGLFSPEHVDDVLDNGDGPSRIPLVEYEDEGEESEQAEDEYEEDEVDYEEEDEAHNTEADHIRLSSPVEEHDVVEIEDDEDDGNEVEDEDDEREGEGNNEADEDEDDLIDTQVEEAHPVELSDAWEGPSTYAEDFYSGGDMRPGTSIVGSAHLLPTEVNTTVGVDTVEEDMDEEFPPRQVVEQPVDIVDPWSAPQTYAEDLYTGGEVLGDVSSLTPSHLTPALSTPQPEEDGMVITPGVLTPLEVEEPEETDSPETEAIAVPTEAETAVDPRVAATEEQVFDPTLLNDFYAEIGQVSDSITSVPDDDLPPSSIGSVLGQESLPHKLHDRSKSPPRMSAAGHIDWTWPPAFQGREAASSELPETFTDDSTAGEPQDIPPYKPVVHEVVEISDDEEDEDPLPHEALAEPPKGLQEPSRDEAEDAILDTVEPLADEATHIPEAEVLSEIEQIIHESVSQESSREVVEDDGFGDLPPTPMNEEVPSVNDTDVFNILATLGDAGRSVFTDPANSTLGDDLTETDFLDFGGVEEMDANPSVPLEDGGEPHGTFSMPTTAETEEYIVSEVVTDEELAVTPEADVMTDHGVQSPAVLEYVVEEMVTEGRETEEPRASTPPTTDGVQLEQESLKPSREKTPDAQATLRDITLDNPGMSFVLAEPDSEDESPRRRRPRFLLARSRSSPSSDRGTASLSRPVKTLNGTRSLSSPHLKLPEGTKPVSSMEPPPEIPRLQYPEPENGSESPTAMASQDTAEASANEHHLVNGVPAPVSADPSVPDPASVWGTRATTPQPEVPSKSRAEELERAAETGGLLKMTLKQPAQHTASGLFTPAADSDSTPASPSIPWEGADAARQVEEDSPAEEVDQSTTDVDEIPPADAAGETSAVQETVPEALAVEAKQDDDDVHDDDADGDLDPEYHGDTSEEPSEQLTPSALLEDNSDPFTLMGSDSKVAPGAVEDDLTPLEGGSSSNQSTSISSSSSEQADAVEDTVPEANGASKGETEEKTEEPVISLPSPVAEEESRPLKRKRMSPPPTPPPAVTRKSLTPEEAAPKAPSKAGDSDAEVDSIASSRDGELRPPMSKGRPQTTRPASRPVSRASSIASSASSASSTSSTRAVEASILPFVHAGGVLHHHHGKAPSRQPSRPLIPSRTASTASQLEPAASGSQSQIQAEAPSQPQAQVQHAEPAPLLHPNVSMAPSSSSPVTRSNCRFHKISIPLDEDAPRVYFVVPGCALTNSELMEEEEIEDHGVATLADNARLVPNVEALNFSEYLIGVLRQLVGVDLLRDQEMFYLPQDGDNIGLKPKSPAKKKPRDSLHGRSTAASTSSRLSRKVLRSPRKSIRRGGSVSTVSSAVRGSRSTIGSASVAGSLSDAEMSDDGAPPKAKRRKAEKRKRLTASTTSSAPTSPTFKTRRSKRLSSDAAAYKPEQKESEGSSDEEGEQPKKSRAKKSQRGTKRGRNSDARQDETEEGKAKSKRRKVHGNNASQETAEG